MGILYKTRCYLVGHMQYVGDSGVTWREYAESLLTDMGVVVYNPTKQNFLEPLDEIADLPTRLQLMKRRKFDLVAQQMKKIRSYDLSLIDRADFILAQIDPFIASWGSSEELTTATRAKRPIFLSIAGGKEQTPLWIMGKIPHKYIYDCLDDSLDMIRKIDSGEQPIDSDRWRLLKNEYR